MLSTLIASSSSVEAQAVKGFNPGRIIDDTVFYNKDSMNVNQIQSFLNKLTPECDTMGTKRSEYGSRNISRAEYAASVGWHKPPYVCLSNYHENPNTKESSYEKGGGAFNGGISAAQIIYNASQKYGINPQVILVLLKKESLLIGDTWPLKSQYTYAMGYACPDSGANFSANCDSSKGGFHDQVMHAAWQLNYYKEHPNDYRYKIGNNQIQYAPDPACGVKNVYIENISTLSLYIYTPYTPNQASLNNYPGTADCGSYGNRNFFMYFKEWFGSPNYVAPSCDARVKDVTCVWRLYNPSNMSQFLTTSNTERDSAVLHSKYSYDSMAFYAYTSKRPGTIPVYRIKLPNQHFYTASEDEKNSLLSDTSNSFEGIAFYVLPSSTSNNISYPVYRFYSAYRGHLLADSKSPSSLLTSDYKDENVVAFNTPSGHGTAPTPKPSYSNIYRMHNGRNHLYTASLTERDSLIKSKWDYEGILQQGKSSASESSKPVYRMFNKTHLFTTSTVERDQLRKSGWKYEGVGWHIDETTPQTYKFYINNHHFLTSSLNEALSITNRGAEYEGVAYSGQEEGDTRPVYRLYNNKSQRHLLTVDINEVLTVANRDWRYEGRAWNTGMKGEPVYRLYKTHHFYTANETEKNHLVKNGWKLEGASWHTEPDGIPIYRLNDGKYHFYTIDANERNQLQKGGWRYEGLGWKTAK